MNKFRALTDKILSGQHNKNTRFNDLVDLLERLGFSKRIKGDHFIFYKEGIIEIINLQPDGNKAKAYQVRQVANLIAKYNLGDDLNV